MDEQKRLSDEELLEVLKKLKKDIIKNTNDILIMCKACGLDYKKRKQPLIKTEDGYICKKCLNKQRLYNKFYK